MLYIFIALETLPIAMQLIFWAMPQTVGLHPRLRLSHAYGVLYSNRKARRGIRRGRYVFFNSDLRKPLCSPEWKSRGR